MWSLNSASPLISTPLQIGLSPKLLFETHHHCRCQLMDAFMHQDLDGAKAQLKRQKIAHKSVDVRALGTDRCENAREK